MKNTGTITVTEQTIADVQAHFGAEKGTAEYVMEYDVNQDGIIDLADLAFFMGSYGKTVQLPQPVIVTVTIYTLKIGFYKLPWYNKSAFTGGVDAVIVPAVMPFTSALGYTLKDRQIVDTNSMVEVHLNFTSKGSPPLPLLAILAAVVAVAFALAVVAVAIAWYKASEAQEATAVTAGQVSVSATEALSKGQITSDQYAAIMSKLADMEKSGADQSASWMSMLTTALPLLIGVAIIGAVMGMLPRRKD